MTRTRISLTVFACFFFGLRLHYCSLSDKILHVYSVFVLPSSPPILPLLHCLETYRICFLTVSPLFPFCLICLQPSLFHVLTSCVLFSHPHTALKRLYRTVIVPQVKLLQFTTAYSVPTHMTVAHRTRRRSRRSRAERELVTIHEHQIQGHSWPQTR